MPQNRLNLNFKLDLRSERLDYVRSYLAYSAVVTVCRKAPKGARPSVAATATKRKSTLTLTASTSILKKSKNSTIGDRPLLYRSRDGK